ncbi:aminopeptidase Ey isoform X2 [Contarinia nasturtii]|uniref:aminopeptidase Ey isoform X2 n=1 Tax=Contarinia nasturtii TaxID=265458 RepID=UPI0012D3A6E6|nr:aminopeptidase Ey isoform X2 [Contarinia nasturtii]
MDSGYINEGGQLKTKNGQKYIINNHHHHRDGFYVTKRHAILIAALILIVMLAYTVLIYFLFAKGATSATVTPSATSALSTTNATNAPIMVSSEIVAETEKPIPEHMLLPTPSGIDPTPRPRAIKLNEGWSPTLYRLIIQPDIKNGTSFGHVIIDITKDASATNWPPIVLDIDNITITKVEVAESSENLTRFLDIAADYGENNDTYVINLVESPNNASLQLNIKFISQLSTTLQGFYRVGYNDIDTTEQKWLVSTQFSPIDARRAFPCFDRPDKKAQFEISLIHHENLTMALSNMPSKLVTRLPSSDYIREDFDITPLMSTYLVAFMATNLVNATQTAKRNESLPQINIWTRKEVGEMTEFAFDLTTRILPFYEEYFGIRYNLPKIDMVAVPEFGFSAMENYGLLTFKESALLVPRDPEHRSAEHSEDVANIIAHELAHQWFGNLVTMKWWDDLWLKEGFATFMSYIVIQEIEPTWQSLEFMSVNELQKAMEEDSDLSSHPISFDVKNSADIRRIFDPISYSKGASIIRMMQSFLGEKTFKEALRKYLKDFQSKNANRGDLWKIMTEFGHRDKTLPADLTVEEIMDNWTKQAGYPVLNVKRDGTSIYISQQRFLLPNGTPNNDIHIQTWHIPITFTIGSNKTEDTLPKYWLKKTDDKITDVIGTDHYFYMNIGRSGYYRVNYDYKSWAALGSNYKELPDIIKAQLIDDSLNLARAEIISYDIPLTFLFKLNQGGVLPWAASTSGIKFISNMLSREPAYEYFRALMRFILKDIYNDMGFEEHPYESHVELLHRAVIVHHACFFSHAWCINSAQLIYRKWMGDKTNNLISPNLKSIVYCTALREGSFQEWYFALRRYKETTDASEKEIILDALGCTTKTWLLSKYLNMTITADSGIRKQDGRRAFIAVAQNSFGFETAFDFLMTNIKEISEYFGDGFLTLSRMINSITDFMNKDYHLEQLKQFKAKAESLGLKSIKESIQLAEKKIQNNVYWRSRSYPQLERFLLLMANHYNINLEN